MLELYKTYMQLAKQNYFEYVLFSRQWWILILIMIGIWSLWVILVDKKRMITILHVGLLSSIIALVLDDIGLNMMWWDYAYRITYFTSRMDPVNFAIIPVCYMLLYQYMKGWRAYITLLFLLSLFGAFITEPIFVKLGVYTLLHWEHWYSFPGYITIGIIVKWFADKLEKNNA